MAKKKKQIDVEEEEELLDDEELVEAEEVPDTSVSEEPKKESNAGRPTVMTPEIISKLEEVFALGGTDEEACFYADIGKSTLYDYQKEHPEFVERKEALKETPILRARRTVVGALEKDSDMALKYLERKRKDEFSVRHNLAIGGDKDTLGELTDFFRKVANPKGNEVQGPQPEQQS